MENILVIDVGGTKTTVSFVASDNSKINILATESFKTTSNPEHTIQKIFSIYKEQNKKISGVSLSLPGVWNKNGILTESYFLHEWLDYPFIDTLKKSLNINQCVWETDVICGALGEYDAFVETLRATSLLYLNLGTGIGAAYIDNEGKVFKSKSDLTLRMQKLVFPFEEELYSAVDLISGGTLVQISKYESVESLYKAYQNGEVEAIDIISRAQTQLAAWLINLFYLFAPDLIVIGGGLTNDWGVLAEGAIDIAKEEIGGEVSRPRFLPGKLKEIAPVYGACVNFMRHSY